MNEIDMKSGDSGKNYENLVISRRCQRNVAKGEKKDSGACSSIVHPPHVRAQ